MKKMYIFLLLFLFSCTPSYIGEKEKIISIQDTSKREIILALGDSLTAGYGVEESENYPSKLQKKLDDGGYNYEVINAGVSGDTSANVLSRASLYVDKNPSIVILVVGGNDALRGLSTSDLQENILKIIDTFPNSKVVLGGMDVPANLGVQYRNEFKKIYTQIASEKKEIYFLKFFLEGVAGNPELNISDMIHPNSEGYDIIVQNLMNFLEENNIITK